MTDAPTPEQAAGLEPPKPEQGDKPKMTVASLVTQPSYTWKCPRCPYKNVSMAPIYSASCPQCNYPEPPPPGFQGTLDPDEQAVEIQRMAAAMNPDDDAARRALLQEQQDETATYDHDGNLVVPDAQSAAPVPQSAAPAAPAAPARLEPGWLAVVIAKVRDEKFAGAVPEHPDAMESFAEAVIEVYEGERWRLLCGCLAGEHGESIEAMVEAHPERVRR